MANQMEKTSNSLTLELEEARKKIQALQKECEETQQQKAKMEALYLSLKKQQKQVVSEEVAAQPMSVIFPTVPSNMHNNVDSGSKVRTHDYKWRGTAPIQRNPYPGSGCQFVQHRNLWNDPIHRDSFQVSQRKESFGNYMLVCCTPSRMVLFDSKIVSHSSELTGKRIQVQENPSIRYLLKMGNEN